ncbi:MAG: sulfatase-like hydrolase/transferase [Planctomycetota bacterium]
MSAPSRTRSWWLALPLLALCACGGGDADELSVLLITLDTTRADRLGCYGRGEAGTPHLDALAQEGVRFERAYTVAPITLPAHTSILTGTTPLYHGVRDNGAYRAPDRLVTLAELMKDGGRRTSAFIAAFPLHREFNLDQGFEVYDDAVDESDSQFLHAERRGDHVVDAALDWLRKLDADETFFSWVHLFDPHAHYDPPSPFAERFPGDPYQGEISFTDACVGRLIDELKKQGRLEKTLIVVVADHGESLGDHDEKSHGLLIYEGTMHVPLIFAGPGAGRGIVRRDVVRTIDIVPTIVELFDLDMPRAVQGAPLDLDSEQGDIRRVAYLETLYPTLHYGWSDLRGAVVGDWKIIEAPMVQSGVPELYRSGIDRAELQDLSKKDPRQLEEMRRILESQAERLSEGRLEAGRDADMTDEDRERLAQLGYVGEKTDSDSGRHPREMIRVKDLFDDAKIAVQEGRVDDMKRILEEIEAIDSGNPGIPEVWGVYYKASAHRDTEARARSIEAFEEAVRLSPKTKRFWKNLADLYEWDGKLDKATLCFEEAMRLGPIKEEVRLHYAHCLERLGRIDEAIEAIRGVEILSSVAPEEALEVGQSKLKSGQRVEALALFEHAAKDLTKDRSSLRRLAMRKAAEVSLALGLKDRARTHLETILELVSQDPWAQRQLEALR